MTLPFQPGDLITYRGGEGLYRVLGLEAFEHSGVTHRMLALESVRDATRVKVPLAKVESMGLQRVERSVDKACFELEPGVRLKALVALAEGFVTLEASDLVWRDQNGSVLRRHAAPGAIDLWPAGTDAVFVKCWEPDGFSVATPTSLGPHQPIDADRRFWRTEKAPSFLPFEGRLVIVDGRGMVRVHDQTATRWSVDPFADDARAVQARAAYEENRAEEWRLGAALRARVERSMNSWKLAKEQLESYGSEGRRLMELEGEVDELARSVPGIARVWLRPSGIRLRLDLKTHSVDRQLRWSDGAVVDLAPLEGNAEFTGEGLQHGRALRSVGDDFVVLDLGGEKVASAPTPQARYRASCLRGERVFFGVSPEGADLISVVAVTVR